MPGTKSPKARTRVGTKSAYSSRGTKASYSNKSAASRQNIKRAQVARVGSHNPYKRTALRH